MLTWVSARLARAASRALNVLWVRGKPPDPQT